MRHLAAGSAAVAVLMAAVLTSGALGAGPRQVPPIPPIPTPPNIPNPPKIPGEKIEKFKLVFEGKSHADRVDDIGGQAGGCDAQMHADINEDVTFGRGKGVTMEFVKYKQNGKTKFGFQRSGRNLDSSFNVVAKVYRTASGSGDLTQHPNSTPCPAQHFDAGQDPDCGKTITDNSKWGLKVVNDHFIPRPGSPDNLVGVDSCGKPPDGSAFSSDIAELFYQWPIPPQFIFEPIPMHKIFNSRYHAFKVEFKTINAEQDGHDTTGVLTENWHDHGNAEATVRFIRQ